VLTLPEAFICETGVRPRCAYKHLYLDQQQGERDSTGANSTIDIAARASASVTKTQPALFSTRLLTSLPHNFGFNLTYIDKGFRRQVSSGFETNYMRSLYQYGYDRP